MRTWIPAAALLVAITLSPVTATAQTPTLEVSGAFASFVDDLSINHAALGVALPFRVTPRLSVGPEFVYMIGPGSDRDAFITGNLTCDLVRPRGDRPAPVVPYLVVGGGLMAHRDDFWSGTYVSWEWAVAGGGGVRLALSDRVTAGGEVRLGWEPHVRVTGVVGIRLGARGVRASRVTAR